MVDLDENKTRQIAQEEITKYMNNKQYTYSKIPAHEHTGYDAPKISMSNLVYAINQSFLLVAYSANPAATNREQFTFNFANPKKISFYGFCANNANGTMTPPAGTKKATINGEARFGIAENLTGLFPTPVTTPDTDSIVQGCNFMYIDEASLANTTVGAHSAYLASAFDESGTMLASVSVINFDARGITLEFYQSIGYYMTGTYFIS